MKLGRYRADGTLWGCSAQQGVFGDWACLIASPLKRPDAFSISYFSNPGPGTGALALFTTFPSLFFWLYGGANSTLMMPLMRGTDEEKMYRQHVNTILTCIYQMSMGFLFFSSESVFPIMHMMAVTCGVLSLSAHLGVMMYG